MCHMYITWKQPTIKQAAKTAAACTAAWLLCTCAACLSGFSPVDATLLGNLGGILSAIICCITYGQVKLIKTGCPYIQYALVTACTWIACQGLASCLYKTFGSPMYDLSLKTQAESGICSTLLLCAVSAPILEELLVRHLLYGMVAKALPRLDNALLAATSILFGCMHGNIIQGFPAVISGMVFCVAYRYGGLLPAWYCHMLFNLYSMVLPHIISPVYQIAASGGYASLLCFLSGMLAAIKILCMKK